MFLLSWLVPTHPADSSKDIYQFLQEDFHHYSHPTMRLGYVLHAIDYMPMPFVEDRMSSLGVMSYFPQTSQVLILAEWMEKMNG